ncbi:MAG: hemolysin III family protein [Betaproteobacteria bacterium]|nr:hemolysin III family protein [Betaproteobacteria bacterium]
MNALPALPRYTLREEIASSVTHGIGILLAIAGLAVLVAFAAINGDAWHVTSCSIFGAALILCFTTSTLYHSVQVERLKHTLRALDHAAIFVLIAGTYTPFLLVNLRGPWGWSLLAVIWGLTFAGIGLRLFLKGRLHGLVVSIYIAMGWIVVVAAEPMLRHVGTGGLILLAAGGLAYTAGVAFYKWKRLPYNHAIWHGFVLAGAALHFFAVLFYVIPWPGTVAAA